MSAQINNKSENVVLLPRQCRTCGELKPISFFPKSKRHKHQGGINIECKLCLNQKSKKWRKNNHAKVISCNANWGAKNPEKVKEQKKRYNKRNKKKIKEKRINRQYGISWEACVTLHQSQGFKCAICKVELDIISDTICVDHCHNTGVVRGILCAHCNFGLGHFSDKIESLESAIFYLSKHRKV